LKTSIERLNGALTAPKGTHMGNGADESKEGA
jgi:hypothetical protein